jgi:pyridoxamine 5'-phosphate oxidase
VERQVRVEGTVIKLPEAESDAYFKSRPRESQIGAWASDQSDEMTSRDQLEKRFQEVTQKFENKDVPRPEFWGGYIIQPSLIEFWQGRASRLHDRIKYEPFENRWKFKRLFP